MRYGKLTVLTAFALALALAWPALAQRPERKGDERGKGGRQRPEVGTTVKDFTLQTSKGAKVSLSEFRDRKIFVLELGACT